MPSPYHVRRIEIFHQNTEHQVGRPPWGGPGRTLVHDGSERHGWGGLRSGSGKRSRPQRDFRGRRHVAEG